MKRWGSKIKFVPNIPQLSYRYIHCANSERIYIVRCRQLGYQTCQTSARYITSRTWRKLLPHFSPHCHCTCTLSVFVGNRSVAGGRHEVQRFENWHIRSSQVLQVFSMNNEKSVPRGKILATRLDGAGETRSTSSVRMRGKTSIIIGLSHCYSLLDWCVSRTFT